MAKVYIANTPLILENEQGGQFRVEVGEAVELTAEQYESVAAHVTPTLTTGEEPDAQQNDTPPSEDTPSDDTGNAPTGEVEKPKRGKKSAAAEGAE
ncbi:phage protein [Neisseria meningitidis]|uniref:hypothetical protein n=1 Tax=Neisseria TaxID=482 RepID=UPI0001D9DAA6|nr:MULTISPECIES: hypothetical protein [Neisseria]EFH22381.1 hypothetical protein NEIPOLOT_01889 [Neisseria polysaccharea ATCC 43768]CWO40808.1 phage protein [Neisseria meningitidis]CWS29627.1 phage protein [Neisseria meningitidis]